MLKSIATACNECKAKQENKVGYNTYDIVTEKRDQNAKKRSKRRLKKEIFVVVKNIVLNKNWRKFPENFLKTIRKNNVQAICMSY